MLLSVQVLYIPHLLIDQDDMKLLNEVGDKVLYIHIYELSY